MKNTVYVVRTLPDGKPVTYTTKSHKRAARLALFHGSTKFGEIEVRDTSTGEIKLFSAAFTLEETIEKTEETDGEPMEWDELYWNSQSYYHDFD